jgi:hypothetical protein
MDCCLHSYLLSLRFREEGIVQRATHRSHALIVSDSVEPHHRAKNALSRAAQTHGES